MKSVNSRTLVSRKKSAILRKIILESLRDIFRCYLNESK